MLRRLLLLGISETDLVSLLSLRMHSKVWGNVVVLRVEPLRKMYNPDAGLGKTLLEAVEGRNDAITDTLIMEGL